MALAVKKGNGAPEAVFSRALLAALPDGALTYSADGECRSANEAAAKLLGIPCERPRLPQQGLDPHGLTTCPPRCTAKRRSHRQESAVHGELDEWPGTSKGTGTA